MLTKLKRGVLFPLILSLCLLPLFALGASATDSSDPFRTYTDGVLTFSAYTEGAGAAFDGDQTTAYDGSVTGMFAKPTVLSGITVLTPEVITDLTVKGSADGVNWVTLYTLNKATAKLPAEFGSAGPDETYTGMMRDEMYTYVLKYVRVETATGEISEIKLFGYKVDVVGQEIALDTSYVNGKGYTVSRSHYDPPKTDYVFDHIIGADWNKGDVSKPMDGDDTKNSYFALKLEKAVPLTEIAFAARSGETSWNSLKRFNHIYIEASVDGTNWVTLTTTPDDFALMPDASTEAEDDFIINPENDLTKYTICIYKVSDTTAYQYVRIRSDKDSGGSGWMNFAEINVYGQDTAQSAPANVLKGWDGDPHAYANDNTVTEPVTEPATTPVTSAPETNAPDTTPTTDEPKKGCGASVGGAFALLLTATVGCGIALGSKKRKN